MARDQSRDEFGRFVAEASEKLKGFSDQVEESTRASSDHTRATKEAAKEAEARTERLGAAATLGAQSFASVNATGDLDAGLANVSQAAIRGIRSYTFAGLPVGEIGAELSGLNRANNVLGAASSRTADVTGDLRRYNIDVPDDFRSDLLKVNIEQEERVEAERRRVAGAAYTRENLTAAGANSAAAAAVTAAQETSSTLKAIFDLLRSFGGGGGS